MASTGEVWKLGHRPALDGVRGVAILLVLVCHSFYSPVTAMGSVGVTVFFTLSGFLITRLLLEEWQLGSVSLGRFYLRRALRLLPAMLTMVTTVAAVRIALGLPTDWRAVGLVYAYLGNLYPVSSAPNWLTHTWSLAVEEQFYLVWPLILIAVLGRWSPTALARVCAVGIVGSVLLRLLWWDGGAGDHLVYLSTLTRADALLVGCLLAAWAPRLVAGRRVPGVAVAGACGTVLLLGLTTGWGYLLVLPTVVPWATAVVVLAVLQGSDAGWSWRPLRWVGRRSYGLYLWHPPVFSFVAIYTGYPGWRWLSISLAATLVMTVLSWRLVEEPFLRLKTRPGAAVSPAPAPVAAPALSRVAAPRG